MRNPSYRQVVQAAEDLANEVGDELYAAGDDDEVQTNPTLLSKRRVLNRCRRVIDAAKQTDAYNYTNRRTK